MNLRLPYHCVQVYSWEPVTTHDVHHVPWGKVADMAISGEQLVLTRQAQKALYECDGLLSIPCRLVPPLPRLMSACGVWI